MGQRNRDLHTHTSALTSDLINHPVQVRPPTARKPAPSLPSATPAMIKQSLDYCVSPHCHSYSQYSFQASSLRSTKVRSCLLARTTVTTPCLITTLSVTVQRVLVLRDVTLGGLSCAFLRGILLDFDSPQLYTRVHVGLNRCDRTDVWEDRSVPGAGRHLETTQGDADRGAEAENH